MNFNILQKEISELVNGKNPSLPDFLRLSKQINEAGDTPYYFKKSKIAFLSDFTLNGLPDAVRARGIFHNLSVDTYLGPYDQYAQETFNEESGLYKFAPDIIFLIVDTIKNREVLIKEAVEKALAFSKATIIVSFKKDSVELPESHRIRYFDFEDWIEKSGHKKNWNTKLKELGDLRLAPDAFPDFAEELLRYPVAFSGATKKCIVADLDNTLWKGVLGEDGISGIVPNQDLQKKLLSFYEKGIILAISSLNNEADAMEAITNHPDMILKKNHFAAWQINWDNKALNIKKLADELSLGTDSFVFIDDDRFQQNMIRESLPEITVIDANDISTLPGFLENYAGFSNFDLTEEDKKRGQMYAEERSRKELGVKFKKLDDFLKELNLEIKIVGANESNIPRISQLTLKTNQFNLTTRRYTEVAVRDLLKKGWKISAIEVFDKFGEYGLTGVAMVDPSDPVNWRIDNILLSCRVLGRGVEKALLSNIIKEAADGGAKKITANFIATPKNKPSEKFLADSDFMPVGKSGGDESYVYEVDKGFEAPAFIKITRI